MKIFDAHSHYMPPEVAKHTTFFKVNWSDLGKQLTLMDQVNIEKSLLLYPTSDAHLAMGGWEKLCEVYNAEISRVVKNYPDRFVGGGILPVDNPEKIVDELKRLDDLNLRVISLASSYEGKYLDDEMFLPLYEFAQKTKRAIHVHPQIVNPIGEERVKDPLLTPVLEYVFDVSICIGKMMMGGIFLKYPDVKFIFAHFGGVLPIVKERFDSTYAMLRRRNFVKDLGKTPSEYFSNLYFDMSGTKSLASLKCALEITSEKNILWGSDYPANQLLQESLNVVRQCFLDDKKVSLVCGDNFKQVVFGV